MLIGEKMKSNIFLLVLVILVSFLPIYIFVNDAMPEYELIETSLVIYMVFIYGVMHGASLINEIYGIWLNDMIVELEILKRNENTIYEEIEKIIENSENS